MKDVDKARTTVDPRNSADAHLRELARLATQKAENLPDGERRFRYLDPAWEWMIALNPPSLARNKGDGFGWHDIDARGPDAPPLGMLAEQFAKLGRAVGFAQKIDALEEERDRALSLHGREYQDRMAAHRRIAQLEDAAEKIVKERDRWKNNYHDSRAEVADLLARLRAEGAADTIKGLRDQLAALEDRQVDQLENVAFGCVAAARALTEGDPRRIVGFQVDIEGHLWATAADGTEWFRMSREDGHPWTQFPPLPPVEPESGGARHWWCPRCSEVVDGDCTVCPGCCGVRSPVEPEIKAGTEECEPVPVELARHDWHTNRGHVSCERCGAPFSEIRKDQACGAQP